MAEQLEVTAELINQKVKFTGISKSHPGQPVTLDYKPPLGDNEGHTGLELLLLSFAGCSGTSIAYLLRKMGKTVSGLKVNAKGIRRETLPLSFSKIYLEFIVSSDDACDDNMQRAIKLSEESVCPVWDMIKNNVEIITDYKIISSSIIEMN